MRGQGNPWKSVVAGLLVVIVVAGVVLPLLARAAALGGSVRR
jgi:hypothetical protein